MRTQAQIRNANGNGRVIGFDYNQTGTTVEVSFARGELFIEHPQANIYTVIVVDGPVRGRDLIWVETKNDDRPGRVLPANEFAAYVGGV